jgi:hypothetical protein
MEKQNELKAGFFKKLFYDCYVVTLYLKDENGTETTRVFHMQKVSRLNNKTLKGIDLDGHTIEFNSIIPFNYEKVKLY